MAHKKLSRPSGRTIAPAVKAVRIPVLTLQMMTDERWHQIAAQRKAAAT